MTSYPVHSPAELQTACARVQAGDVVLVHAGCYATPSTLTKKRGSLDRPIVIRMADDGWVSGGKPPDPAWGGGDPAKDSPPKPGPTDFAFLVIDDCAHIAIDGLRIRDCWPSIFFVKDTDHLTLRNCWLRNGTYAIFAKGTPTSHLLIEDNEWRQDDSPEHLLWTQIDWARAHGGEGADGAYRYFNGGFLSSKNIRGNVVVRRNRIMDAYNGIRLKADDPLPKVDQMPRVNADIHIVDNDFIRIRDNPVEPEAAAFNWHVRHNRLLDCHAWFSFDGVTGGYWYFYGNTGRFDTRQGTGGIEGHTMGRVLKLSYETQPPDPASVGVPIFPWFVFNNSWHLRCPLIGGANPIVPAVGEGPDFTAHLDFFNNAFAWCDPGRYGNWVCEPIEIIHFLDFPRSTDTHFDYDISDRSDFVAYFQDANWGEANGLTTRRPLFEDLQTGKFALAMGSDAHRSGWVRDVPQPGSGGGAPLRKQADGTLNRGAIQDYGLIQVPNLEAQTAALLTEMGVEV